MRRRSESRLEAEARAYLACQQALGRYYRHPNCSLTDVARLLGLLLVSWKRATVKVQIETTTE